LGQQLGQGMGKNKTFDKPDFIGIGPPKTGTTWIYENLRKHPQVVMPPDKELRYFWERVFVGQLTHRQRKDSCHWHHQARQVFCHQRLEIHRQALKRFKIDAKTLLWDLKYAYGRHTDRWYASLFAKDAVSGEISAKYCELPDDEIARIKAVFPNLKILITLRDPIEREWSRAKMNLCKKRNRQISEVSDEEFIAQFNDHPQFESNKYKKLIELWENQFGKNQVLTLFYDELLENPFAFFCNVCDFLQIRRPTREEETRLKGFVFKGVSGDISTQLKLVLFGLHKQNIKDLIDYLPEVDYPEKWMEKYG